MVKLSILYVAPLYLYLERKYISHKSAQYFWLTASSWPLLSSTDLLLNFLTFAVFTKNER